MSTIASHSTLNISETVRDGGLVPKDHQLKIAYGESNNHVTPKRQVVTPIRLELNINRQSAVRQYGRPS